MFTLFPQKKCPIIYQSEHSECGLACLAMISSFYQRKTNLISLRKEFNFSESGMSIRTLCEYAAQIKLGTRPLQADIHEMSQLRLPCILHWDLNHFVILTKFNKKKVTIHDPALGIINYSIEKFKEHYTGIAVEIFPAVDFEKGSHEKGLKLSPFWNASVGLKSGLFKILIASALLQIFSLASPYYMQLIIDDVIVNQDRELLTLLFIAFSMLALVSLCTSIIRDLIGLHIQNHLNIQWSSGLFSHLIKLPITWFEKRHIGDIVSRFSSQGEIQSFITSSFVSVLLDGLMVTTTLIMMYIYSPKLTFIATVAVIIYALVRWAFYRPFRQNAEENITSSAKENTFFLEGIRHIQAIRLHGHEDKRKNEWLSLYSDVINLGIKGSLWSLGFSSINTIIFAIENMLVIYFSANLVMDGLFSIGMMMAFMSYKGQFSTRVNSLIDSFVSFKMLDIHLSRLSDIALEPEEENRNGLGLSGEIIGRIQLENISFRYGLKSNFLFENVNLTLEFGDNIAITGLSGCGKTTLLKIILGLLEPTTGRVLFDGIDIRKIGLVRYRKLIGSVMQNDSLLSGTLTENISFFDEIYNQSKVEYSCRLASIHDDIENLPMGYQTLIGDMGIQLSGGQVQRILLARALYLQPRILVLDEATSNLDINNEQRVNSGINSLPVTRILVTHRESTLSYVDKIYNLTSQGLEHVSLKVA
ncbi:peptidase domain-containing ABC transporter [Shewanella baltica]|uniref:Colicin V processing peptidase. Cysteine peptidase. MEROPS family C39 n=1 Tax=Shewanella baltica (strain OS155 / ATCC BAA-1091) TaxID=325240 RepID=A3D4K8_SHEB5|nr:peptidase domain-containing ABC transporter [Shewanella baltica]ABN61671.1 colicin V processing peptidase. Cysteine peptidase. MEROPS family C39 [Shewanella baltica OS155]